MNALLTKGIKVPSNTHFTTTHAWCYYKKAEPVDFVSDEYMDPNSTSRFKGNMNIPKFEKYFIENAALIPLVEIVIPNNLNGGQPVSMENIKAVRAIIDKHKKRDTKLYLDIARISENAWLIKQFEEGYKNKTCLEIVNECLSYADGCHMSSKKGALVNMGGFISLLETKLHGKGNLSLFVWMLHHLWRYGWT